MGKLRLMLKCYLEFVFSVECLMSVVVRRWIFWVCVGILKCRLLVLSRYVWLCWLFFLMFVKWLLDY